MTRAEIEADIGALRDIARNAFADGEEGQPYRDLIARCEARLRADLAKLDGPAPGFVRVRVGVAVDRHGLWVAAGEHRTHDEDIVRNQLLAGPGDSISWITADVPLPRVVEVEGKVEK